MKQNLTQKELQKKRKNGKQKSVGRRKEIQFEKKMGHLLQNDKVDR